MRKLKLQVQLSVDGFIAGPNAEMDWMTFNWDDALKNYVNNLTEPVDTIVLGRRLAEGFIPYWAGVAADPGNPEVASGKKFTDTPKVVFTQTLDKPEWGNTTLAKGNLTDEITKLKMQAGNDIIAYGGANFVSSLIQHGLVDEYHLFVNPVILGNGMPIFRNVPDRQPLNLVNTQAFSCGITVLHYQPKR